MSGMQVSGIMNALKKVTSQMLKEGELVAAETAAEMERYAKTHKRWQRRTGHAEDCLVGEYSASAKSIRADIRQDMFGISGKEYGYWLEKAERFHGKYAILEETRNCHADMFFSGLEKAFSATIRRTHP